MYNTAEYVGAMYAMGSNKRQIHNIFSLFIIYYTVQAVWNSYLSN